MKCSSLLMLFILFLYCNNSSSCDSKQKEFINHIYSYQVTNSSTSIDSAIMLYSSDLQSCLESEQETKTALLQLLIKSCLTLGDSTRFFRALEISSKHNWPRPYTKLMYEQLYKAKYTPVKLDSTERDLALSLIKDYIIKSPLDLESKTDYITLRLSLGSDTTLLVDDLKTLSKSLTSNEGKTQITSLIGSLLANFESSAIAAPNN